MNGIHGSVVGKKQVHIARKAPFGGATIVRPSPEKAPEPLVATPPAVKIMRPLGEGSDAQVSGYVKIFRFYGCYLEEFIASNGGKQLRGNCPFPDCENPKDHFFAKPGTGQWDCKRCMRKGNVYDFIRYLHELYFGMTTDSDYADLAKLRPGINKSVMKHWKLAYNSHTQEWMIPTFNAEGKITNIHVWREYFDEDKQENKMILLATPSLKLGVYGLQQFAKESRTLPTWILEGHWDTLAFHSILMNMNLLDSHRFLGVPGAGTFPKEQLTILSGADVRLCYDNDTAGKNGSERVMASLGSYSIIPSKLSTMGWPEAVPEKFDVRDLATAYAMKRKDPPFNEYKNPLAFLQKNQIQQKLDQLKTENEGYDPEVEPLFCPSFEALVESCRSKLHFTQGLENSLAILLAVNLSVSLGGNPLWIYLVGPPSSGKTTLADIMAASHPYCISKSKITGIFSGWKGSKDDPGMLPKFQNRTLIIKDFTTILALPPGVQEGLFSQLRDVYDGDADVSYLNGQSFSYRNIKFSIVACTTDEIRAWNRTALGERFLHVEIDSHWDEDGTLNRFDSGTEEHMMSAMNNTVQAIINPNGSTGKIDLKEPKCLCWGLLEHLHHQIESDKGYITRLGDNIMKDEPFMLYVNDLAKWCSLARTHVNRDRGQDLAYRPRPELGLRLASQLVKLSIALCIVFQIETPDQRVIDIIRKVALDTSIGFQLEIMLHIAHHPDAQGLSKDQLAGPDRANISGTQMSRWLSDLMEIKVIQQGQSSGMVPKAGKVQFLKGRKTNLFTLTPDTQTLAQHLGFSAIKVKE